MFSNQCPHHVTPGLLQMLAPRPPLTWFFPFNPFPLSFVISSLLNTMALPPDFCTCYALILGAQELWSTWLTVMLPSRVSLSAFHKGSFSVTLALIWRPRAMFPQFPTQPTITTLVTLYGNCWLTYVSRVWRGYHDNKTSKTYFSLLLTLSFSLCSLVLFHGTL